MADDIMKVTDVLEVFANEITDSVNQVAEDFREIINNPELIKKAIEEQIRINHCKDLKGKLDNGGKPITQEQIDQCLAFVTGDYSKAPFSDNTYELDQSR